MLDTAFAGHNTEGRQCIWHFWAFSYTPMPSGCTCQWGSWLAFRGWCGHGRLRSLASRGIGVPPWPHSPCGGGRLAARATHSGSDCSCCFLWAGSPPLHSPRCMCRGGPAVVDVLLQRWTGSSFFPAVQCHPSGLFPVHHDRTAVVRVLPPGCGSRRWLTVRITTGELAPVVLTSALWGRWWWRAGYASDLITRQWWMS